METQENTTTGTTKENVNDMNNTNSNNAVYDDCGCKNPNAFAQTIKDGFNSVFGNMKSVCIALVAAIAIIVGCKSIPSTDTMYSTSYAVGAATGMVVNMTDIDSTNRTAIVEIMNIVQTCVPETNQTFEAAWTPIAEAHTKKLVDEGKIDAKAGEVILSAFHTVTKGIDYLFTVRYPKARQYQDLTEAAVHGFTSGFLTVFKPVNETVSVSIEECYDRDAYDYLIGK